MTNPKITLPAIAACLMLSGCEPYVPPKELQTEKTNNSTIPVDLLFEHDGCKVYHFVYAHDDHFYTDCRGSTTTMQPHRCGKLSCPKPEEITTVGRPQP